jgi:hypothetical protein
MPPAIPVPVRHNVLRRSQQGQSAATIAAALALCPRSVRHLLQRFRDAEATDLRPQYQR